MMLHPFLLSGMCFREVCAVDMVWLIYSLFLWCWQVVGELASQAPAQGHKLSGILVKRNFSFHLMTPKDLHSESKTTRTKNTWISCKELLQITMWETLFVIPTPVDRTKHNTATYYIIIYKKFTNISELTPKDFGFSQAIHSWVHFWGGWYSLSSLVYSQNPHPSTL